MAGVVVSNGLLHPAVKEYIVFPQQTGSLLRMCYTLKSPLKLTAISGSYTQSHKSIIGAMDRRAARTTSDFPCFLGFSCSAMSPVFLCLGPIFARFCP